jgi:hypothetical protein
LIAAALYWALTAIFTFFQRKLERRVGRGFERAGIAPGKAHPRILSLSGTTGTGAHLPAVIDVPDDQEGSG